MDFPKRRHPWLKRFFLSVLLVSLAGGSLCGYWVYKAPKLSGKAIEQNQSATEYLDAHGKVFYSNDVMPLKKVSKAQFKNAAMMKDALLSIEDRDFYKETGTNPKRIAGAAYHDILGVVGKGSGSMQGASTLTQQLIKVSYFSTKEKDRTIKRKVQEFYLAEKLNRDKSKNDILYAYFNKVYLGNGIHGMQTATKYYFNKNVDQLSASQAAMIAGMVQSPTYYDPYRRPDITLSRRNTVLKTMLENHKLTKKEYLTAKKTPLTEDMPTYRTQIDNLRHEKQVKMQNDNYVSAVNAQLNGTLHEDGNSRVMKIKTPFEPDIQQAVNDAVNSQKYPSDNLQTAVVVINNQTGQVVALNGGRLNSRQVMGGYNRAITSSRSSGSAIKPVLDYAPVFDMFHLTPESRVDDSAYNYPGTSTSLHDWDNRYQGLITMRKSLVGSRNIPAVKNFVRLGYNNQKQLLDTLGIPTKDVFAPIAIGTNTSPLALTDAYTSLANGGVRMTPQFVTQVEYQGQKMKLNSKKVDLYAPGAAYMTTDILKGVFSVEGLASDAKIDGINQAGKPGAADGGAGMPKDALTDAWFVGYTPSYTVGVWTGYDNPYNKNEYLKTNDEQISQEIYKKVMTEIVNRPGYDKTQDFVLPNDINKNNGVLTWNSNDGFNNGINSNLPFSSANSKNNAQGGLTTSSDVKSFFAN